MNFDRAPHDLLRRFKLIRMVEHFTFALTHALAHLRTYALAHIRKEIRR